MIEGGWGADKGPVCTGGPQAQESNLLKETMKTIQKKW